MIRKFVQRCFGVVQSMVPFWVIKRIWRLDWIIPCYHIVTDERAPHIRHLYAFRGIRQFHDDLDFLVRHYTPVSLDDLINNMDGGCTLKRPPLLLTFDDGLREARDVVAPILKDKGIPAVFFLCTAFLDNRKLFFRHMTSLLVERLMEGEGHDSPSRKRQISTITRAQDVSISGLAKAILSISYQQESVLHELARVLEVDFDVYLRRAKPYLTTDQVNELLADGFAIGAHSVDHPYYGSIGLEEQLQQTRASLQELAQRFDIKHNVFAFPFTDSGVKKEFFEHMADEGISLCFGTAGMNDSCRHNVQRICMEHNGMSARTIIALQSTKAMLRSIAGKNWIERP